MKSTNDLENLRLMKRGIERLNPKLLAAGQMVGKFDWSNEQHKYTRTTPCVAGAMGLAMRSKGRIEPEAMYELFFGTPRTSPLPKFFAGSFSDNAMVSNDTFRNGANTVEACKARWKFMHRWLTQKIKFLEKSTA